MPRHKNYLIVYLNKKMSECFQELNPVVVFLHLVHCDRRIRFVNKCKQCTRFYVYSSSAIKLIKESTMLPRCQPYDEDITDIYADVKKQFAYLNVY